MEEVIERFNQVGVRYLVIGGQAVRLAGYPRFSMDWDIFIPPRDSRNIALINRLLGDDLDAPLLPLGPRGENFIQTYQTRWGVMQFHLGGPTLPDFDDAEKRAVERATEEGVKVRCLGLEDLLESKRRAGRPQDLEDVEFLKKTK